jgi:hypothetical protein
LILIMLLILSIPSVATAQYADLLDRYVVQERWVDYDGWRASTEDRAALQAYIDGLVATDIFALEHDEQIAAWINLYNALTVDLILDNEPVASIKDLGTLMTSPWEPVLVTVAGRELSLNTIEHEILRKDFEEPRIHFALNCASVSCPPLASREYTADNLDSLLDEVASRALHDDTWFDPSGCGGAYGPGALRLTRLFDWFSDDFGGEDGVRAFIQRYRPELRFQLLNTGCTLEYMDYDWNLNAPPESGT